jgi:type VI secretion system protein ImpK
MNDAFAQLVTPILKHGADLQRRIEDGEQPDLQQVKAELLELFATSESRAGATRELASEFTLAKYALVYWADEILIDSRWTHADSWRAHILEWDYYKDNHGGDKFYDRAEDAMRLTGIDPLETFFLCVALGFQGKLATSQADLKLWAERAYARISSSAPASERYLPDEPRSGGGVRPLPGKALLLVVSILAAGTMVATLVGFLLTAHLTEI